MHLMRASLAAFAAIGAMGVVGAGCAPGGAGPGGENSGKGFNAVGSSNVHFDYMTNGVKAFSSPSGAQLTYYGGPVISSVKIWTVFWNSSVQYQSELNGFYTTITQSAYLAWLSEYDTSTQSIGLGSLGGSVVDTGAPPGSNVTDAQVQQEVARLISAGKLPPNDGDNLYMVYFPPGVTITDGSDQSCQTFCAYHGTSTLNGADLYYGVLPNLGGACAGGCGDGDQLQNTTSVSSHEMAEAITDAAVGLATGSSAPLAWYDQSNGEIGDICNAQQTQVSGYTVQLLWSNQQGACVASGPGNGGTGSSTSSSSGNGSSGNGSSGNGSGSSGNGAGGGWGSGSGAGGGWGSGAGGGAAAAGAAITTTARRATASIRRATRARPRSAGRTRTAARRRGTTPASERPARSAACASRRRGERARAPAHGTST